MVIRLKLMGMNVCMNVCMSPTHLNNAGKDREGGVHKTYSTNNKAQGYLYCHNKNMYLAKPFFVLKPSHSTYKLRISTTNKSRLEVYTINSNSVGGGQGGGH